MRIHRRALVLGPLVLACTVALGGAQAPVAPAPVTLTPEQMATFLQTAKIVARKVTEKGVTKPIQATLSDGTITHDAQIQKVNEARAIFEAGKASEVGFKDSYKFNIAGYRLAQILGLPNVPMSVERRVDRSPAALTWWVDAAMDESGRVKLKTVGSTQAERASKYLNVMYVWDELIQNRDRNAGNMLWTGDWMLWMIDHTRAFRTSDRLLKPEQLTRCDRAFLDAMRRLTPQDMEEVRRGGYLTKDEAAAVLKRRDRIVKHFEDLIATRGEAAVLFTLES